MKMKIVCTKEEKNKLMGILYRADECPVYFGCECILKDKCFQCMNEHIEWEITDEGDG